MKKSVSLAVVTMSLVACASAGAWGIPGLPSIPGLPGVGSLLGGGGASVDPDAFLLKARASEALVNKSAEQLFSLVASKEEQAKVEEQQRKIDETSDAKEKAALVEEKVSSQLAAIGNASANKQLEAEAKRWSSEKKKLAANSLFNLALGGKMAAELVPQGQGMVGAIKTNPLLLAKLPSMYQAVKCLGGIGVGCVKVMKAIPPVFTAAKIDVKLPTSAAETPKNADL
jgi:hypothetical protein